MQLTISFVERRRSSTRFSVPSNDVMKPIERSMHNLSKLKAMLQADSIQCNSYASDGMPAWFTIVMNDRLAV
jgi:hypothetical protein